jgi:hypothetical protein
MLERPAVKSCCKHCGAEEHRALGPCHICGDPVCDACGNSQVSSEKGRIATHTTCMRDRSFMAANAFKFIKFVK